MASEDVIELGSSDDEAEPTTKKIKPTPNAMVHIPRKLHDVTIKPAKRNVSSFIPKELAGKCVTVTKIPKNVNVLANPYAVKNKINGKQVQIKQVLPKQTQQRPIPQKLMPTFTQVTKKPIMVQSKSAMNPLSLIEKINSQVVINKVPLTPKVLKNPIKVQSPRSINNLPPSITVTRTAGTQKRVGPVLQGSVRKKQKSNIPKPALGEFLTVNLDDDEVSSSSTASPQWYLRPEEQTASLEEENNKEFEPFTASDGMIEITIEDSPVKPIKNKRTCEALTVTIDDSPVKTILEKNTTSGSDGEAKFGEKVPHSKKKLEYPKEVEEETKVVRDTVEIEISPIVSEDPVEEILAQPSKIAENVIIEIEESPMKAGGQGTSTPKKDHPKPELSVPDSTRELQKVEVTDDLSEFHPVYQSFIRLCFQLENSEDMKKIVEKKIKTYYRQVPKEYTESDDFTDMVAGKVLAMKAGPEKMYLYIKDIVDELNLQRKMAKSQILNNINEKKNTESEKYLYGADSEYDSKRQRQIRKLEKTLKKLHRAIQKLEEQEVDFDDDEDSVYLLTESDEGSTSNKDSDRQLEKDPKALLQRYKERMVRVHAKFCQLTNTKMPSEPRVQIDARPGQATGPAKKLEKWINKKVPIGTPLPFPDFHDVLRCVRESNEEDKLGWNEADIMEEARDLFTRCGKKLQRRRQENEWRIAASRISVELDPAENNQELKQKLDHNQKIAAKKEADVFNKFADRQNQLKLEAEEIGDNEGEESPADDDEEEVEHKNEKSLENKEKRKERLKRLLQEKSYKTADETENNKDNELGNETSNELQDEKCEERDNNKEDKMDCSEGDTISTENVHKIINQDDNKGNAFIGDDIQQDKSKSKENNVELDTLSQNKVVSENESVKTIDSDTTEIVTNKKITTSVNHPIKSIETLKDLESRDNVDNVQSISDDSNKLESDVDELHLLQKLHSGTEVNTSTLESSDSETPIAISDTLQSNGDSDKMASSDVISIENSSYSESEINKELTDSRDIDEPNKFVEETVDVNTELECSNMGIKKKQVKTNNDEYNESIEDILLASTDDEVEIDRSLKPTNDNECVNLKDDSISIGDTVVEGQNQDDGSSVDSIACVSSNEDSPAESNMDTKIVITNTEGKNEKTATVVNTEDSLESENSVQSVHVIESKSSSDKELDTVEGTISNEERVNISKELAEGHQKAIVSEEMKDTFGKSTGTLGDKEKKDTPEKRTDSISGDQTIEHRDDKNCNKL